MTLAPDVTELAFALGLGDFVVCDSAAADFPAPARLLPHVADNDPESIVACRPDLVLATAAGNDPRVVAQLRRLGLRVFTADVTSCRALADAYERLGRVVERAGTAEGLARDVLRRRRAVVDASRDLPERAALFVVWWQPLIVAAPGSFHDAMLRDVRLSNLAPAGAGRYPRLDPELLLDPRLEVVVVPDEPELRQGFRAVTGSPAGGRLERGDVRVIWLPADPASRPGPRLPDALEALLADREGTEGRRSGTPGPRIAPRPTAGPSGAPTSGPRR